MLPEWLCSFHGRLFKLRQGVSPWVPFLVWCGFALFLAMAHEGWNSALQRMRQRFTGLWMLETRRDPFHPVSPRSQETSKAPWVNVRLLAQPWIKFLLAACWVSGAHRFGVLVVFCRFFEAFQKAGPCRLPMFSQNIGSLEPAVCHSLFVVPQTTFLERNFCRPSWPPCCWLLAAPWFPCP